ncbi:MAG: DUF86 domain-containing protein [Parabacteroides sp.]|nr:DUF86 domain-containing protein [Parabacteroides sp.]
MDNYTKKHLQDILTAIEEIESFFGGCPKCFDDFSQTLWRRRAIERNIEIIGEAMNRILKANINKLYYFTCVCFGNVDIHNVSFFPPCSLRLVLLNKKAWESLSIIALRLSTAHRPIIEQ